MDHLAKLVAALALAYASTSHAGYAQLNPPPGWTSATSSSPATFSKAANQTWAPTNTVRTSASLNVGGRAVTVPVAMRMATNAPQFLAGRIGAGMVSGLGGPIGIGLTLGAMLVLPKVTDWISQTDNPEYQWNPRKEQWEKLVQKPSVCFFNGISPPICYGSPSEACAAFGAHYGLPASLGANNYCATDPFWRSTFISEGPGSGEVVWTPADYPTEVRPAIEPLEFPPGLPDSIPMPWPVQQPVINPGPANDPQPLFVPTGNPVPNPNYNPNQAPSPTNQPYFQPGVRVVPAPTPDNPWRVDVQPVDKPVDNPNPSPDPVPEPVPDPGEPDPNVPRDPDLCEKNPDILACQKVVLKDLDAKPLANADKTMAINPDTGWGPSGGTCPPPRTASVMGVTIAMPFTMLCDFATAIKPLFIAMAWLSAAMAFLGLGRKD